MPDKTLLRFIRVARERGFDDIKIREALIGNGWELSIVEEAFVSMHPAYKFKNKVCIYLDSAILKKIDARAKKNLFTTSEQIEDIIRRSVASAKQTPKAEKLDDMLVTLFSRKRRN